MPAARPDDSTVALHLHLDSETVDHVSPAQPVIVEVHASIRQTLSLMSDTHQGAALVCRDGRLVGVFTERDALRLMAGDADMDAPVEHAMTPNPDTLSRNAVVEEAIAKMSTGGYRRLPIVDDAGHPVGMVRVTDILHYLVEHFPNVVYTLPPRPHHGMQKREGA